MSNFKHISEFFENIEINSQQDLVDKTTMILRHLSEIIDLNISESPDAQNLPPMRVVVAADHIDRALAALSESAIYSSESVERAHVRVDSLTYFEADDIIKNLK